MYMHVHTCVQTHTHTVVASNTTPPTTHCGSQQHHTTHHRVNVLFVEQHGQHFADKATNQRIQRSRGLKERPEEL